MVYLSDFQNLFHLIEKRALHIPEELTSKLKLSDLRPQLTGIGTAESL